MLLRQGGITDVRSERIEALASEERWNEGDSVFGLPKVRVFKPKRRVKVAKKETEGEVAEGAVAAEGEAAADATPGEDTA